MVNREESDVDIPSSSTFDDLIQLANQKGLEVFKGRQFDIVGNISLQQIDELTAVLDSEVAVVRFQDGTRIVSVSDKRLYSLGANSFKDRGSEVVCHLHTHVPHEKGKLETLRKGPSTTDLAYSEGVSVFLPQLVRAGGKTYEYKVAARDESNVVYELQAKFLGDPEEEIWETLQNPDSDMSKEFYKIIKRQGINLSDTKRVNQLKRRYASEQASEIVIDKVHEWTDEESLRFTDFMVSEMTSPKFQEEHSGSYIREVDPKEFDRLFNPPATS